jgi:hypothetical protein
MVPAAKRRGRSVTGCVAGKGHAVVDQRKNIQKSRRIQGQKQPGRGNTEFVDWQLVTGTLKKGFDWYQLLQHPFAKAAYMMFLISEVHPFLTETEGRRGS